MQFGILLLLRAQQKGITGMKKSTLKRTVSIAEIISSLAIVVSIIYVAYEYHRTSALTNRDVENIIYDRMLEMDRLIIENPDMAKIILKASNDPENLLAEEKLRFLAYEHILYDSWESAWYYYHEGILEQQNWEGWNSWFIDELNSRPLLSWEGNRKNFNGAFLDYVDSIFSERNKQSKNESQ